MKNILFLFLFVFSGFLIFFTSKEQNTDTVMYIDRNHSFILNIQVFVMIFIVCSLIYVLIWGFWIYKIESRSYVLIALSLVVLCGLLGVTVYFEMNPLVYLGAPLGIYAGKWYVNFIKSINDVKTLKKEK